MLLLALKEAAYKIALLEIHGLLSLGSKSFTVLELPSI